MKTPKGTNFNASWSSLTCRFDQLVCVRICVDTKTWFSFLLYSHTYALQTSCLTFWFSYRSLISTYRLSYALDWINWKYVVWNATEKYSRLSEILLCQNVYILIDTKLKNKIWPPWQYSLRLSFFLNKSHYLSCSFWCSCHELKIIIENMQFQSWVRKYSIQCICLFSHSTLMN